MTPFLVTLICGFILHVATLTLEDKVLEQMNEIRQTISKGNEQCAGHLCPPPANPLQPFIWDNGLAYAAEKHARSCLGIGVHADTRLAYSSWMDFCKKSGASDCPGASSKRIRSFDGVGENMGAKARFVGDLDSMAKTMVSEWDVESKKYIWDNPPSVGHLSSVGHWTQLAWEETNYVGCYVHYCEVPKKMPQYSTLVCKYFPPQYANKGKFLVPYEVPREEKIKSEATPLLHKATKSRATKKSGEKRRPGEGPLPLPPRPRPRAHISGKHKTRRLPPPPGTGLPKPLAHISGKHKTRRDRLPPPPGTGLPKPLAHISGKHKVGLLPPPPPGTGLPKLRRRPRRRPRPLPRAVPDEKLLIDRTILHCGGDKVMFICSYTCPAEGTTERSFFLDNYNPSDFRTELRKILREVYGKNLEEIEQKSERELKILFCRTRETIAIKGTWSVVKESTRMVNLLYWNYGILIGLYLMNVVLIIAFCGGICCVILFLMKKWFFLKE